MKKKQNTEQHNLSEVRFVSIKENRKIGSLTLSKDIPLPLLLTGNSGIEDVELSSIAAGLIKVIAHDPENKDIDYYRQVLMSLKPSAAKELSLAGQAKTKTGDYFFAEELYLAVNHLTGSPESFINLATLYSRIADEERKKENDVSADLYEDRIISVLNDCRDRYPDYAPVYYEIASYHQKHDFPEEARENLEKFINLTKDGQARLKAGEKLKNLEKKIKGRNSILYAYDKILMDSPEDAVKEINGFLEQNAPTWEAMFLRGWAFRIMEKYEEAQKDLLESLKIDSENAEVYNELSICARESGNRELAENYLQIAIDLDEKNVIYMANLAFLYFEDGEYSLCRQLIEKARAEDEDDPQLKYIMEMYEKVTGDDLSERISEDVRSHEELNTLKEQGHEEI